MSDALQDKTVAFAVASEGIEQVELTEPWQAVEQAGGTPRLLFSESGSVQGFHHLDKADTFTVDQTFAEVDAADFDALVLPGGVANPDALRTDQQAVDFIGAFMRSGKPVAAICHAPWTLVEADVLPRADHDVVVEPANRPAQRRRHLGRRGGRCRRQPDHQP